MKEKSLQLKKFLKELKAKREDEFYEIDFDQFSIHLLVEILEFIYGQNGYNQGSVYASDIFLKDKEYDDAAGEYVKAEVLSYLVLTSAGMEIVNSGLLEFFLINEDNEFDYDNISFIEEVTGLTVMQLDSCEYDACCGVIGRGREDVIFFNKKLD